MKFSSQEEFGLRCLLQIAELGPNASMTISEISKCEGLTQTHVAKLLMILRKAGFVVSTRGQQGGYALAAPPELLSVKEILSALGGKLYDDEFCGRHSGVHSICAHSVDCSVRSVWQVVQTAVDGALMHLTLADLIRKPQTQSNVKFLLEPRVKEA